MIVFKTPGAYSRQGNCKIKQSRSTNIDAFSNAGRCAENGFPPGEEEPDPAVVRGQDPVLPRLGFDEWAGLVSNGREPDRLTEHAVGCYG